MKGDSQKAGDAAVYDEAYTNYQLRRSRIRKSIRRIYLNHTLRFVIGKAIDFGCGVGELLKRLPEGSIGLEVNEATVRYCHGVGLNVMLYKPEADGYELKDCRAGGYKTLILSHVLEHMETPHRILHLLLESCRRLGIERIIVIVPGKKGFLSDQTHKTFIDVPYLKRHYLFDIDGYNMKTKHFPLNVSWLGKYFTHHELVVLYESNK